MVSTSGTYDQASGQAYSRRFPANFHTRRERFRRYLEQHPGGAFARQAEEAIQKQDYVAAEPLLQKVVDRDPNNYVAWFDLGFVQNALGKVDGSIAAYRKSVAAKPDVLNRYLIPRPGEGSDIAKAVLYFMAADWVTGEVTDVNGGYFID